MGTCSSVCEGCSSMKSVCTGQVARRVVRHLGLYAFESAAITPGPPIPDWLTDVRDHAA